MPLELRWDFISMLLCEINSISFYRHRLDKILFTSLAFEFRLSFRGIIDDIITVFSSVATSLAREKISLAISSGVLLLLRLFVFGTTMQDDFFQFLFYSWLYIMRHTFNGGARKSFYYYIFLSIQRVT